MLPFEFSTIDQDVDFKIAKSIQQDWKQIGVTCVIKHYPLPSLVSKFRSGNYQICRRVWLADYIDPTAFLDLFESKETKTNNTFWEDPKFQEIFAQIQNEINEDQRKILCAQTERILMEAMPVIPLFGSTRTYATKSYVKNIFYTRLSVLEMKTVMIQESQNDNNSKG